jgi:hypothetical protein
MKPGDLVEVTCDGAWDDISDEDVYLNPRFPALVIATKEKPATTRVVSHWVYVFHNHVLRCVPVYVFRPAMLVEG